MADSILFNEISLDIDTEALVGAFDVFWLRIASRETPGIFSKIMTQINTAMVRAGSGYLLILEKESDGAEKLAKMEGVICQKQSARILGRYDPIDLARALLRALPRVKKSRFFSDGAIGLERGLYYYVKKIHGGDAVRSLRIDMQSHEDRRFLTVSQQTFLRGDLVPRNKKRGRFSYRIEDGHILFQSNDGDENTNTYYMGAFGHSFGQSTHLPFYDFLNYRECKVNILTRFIEDFNRVYEGICSIRFIQNDTASSWRRKSKPSIDTHSLISRYPEIRWNIVKVEPTIDIDNAMEELALLSERSISFSDTVDPCSFNLLVHYDKDSYKGGDDPYKTLRKKYPDANISSITPDSIASARLTNALEVVCKEAVIKEDLRRKKLSIPWIGKEMFFGFSFSLDVKGNLTVTHLMRIKRDGALTHAVSYPSVEPVNGILREIPLLRHIADRAGRSRPFCFDKETGEWFIIETLPKFPLPELGRLRSFHNEIENARVMDKEPLSQDKKILLAKRFCDKMVFTPKERTLFMEEIRKKWIGEGKIPPGKRGNAFRNYLLVEHGLRYGTHGLKGSKGILGYMEGIWFDHDRKEYYVGTVNPMRSKIEKTPKVRRVMTNADTVPEWFFELMEVGFVKNKDMTVLPYPFKYVREYIRYWYQSHETWDGMEVKSLSSIIAEMYNDE